MPFLFVSQSFEVKTLPCVSAVMERLFVSKTLQCVCVCVVYKRIPFFFVSQSFEVKTLPCVSAVMELLFVSKTLQYVCVCVLWAREYRSFSYRSRSK